MKRSFALLAIVSLLVFSGVPGTAAPEPYDLYVVLPLTGSAAFLGQGIAKTLGVEQDLINKRGGVRGRPVRFVISDDQSSPAVAVQLTNGIIAKGAPIIIGSALSAMCQAQASVVAKGPVLWCLSPGIHPAAGSFAFATAQDTQDYIEACLRYAIGRGWHKLGVVSTTDASGQDFDAGFDRISSRPEFRSVTIVDREHFNVADLSVAAVVSRVKNAGPDALLTWVTGSAFSTFLRALADAGVDDPLFSSPVNLLAAQLKSIQPIVPSTLMFPATASYAPNMLIGPLKHVVLDYLDALHAAGMTPDQSTAVPWSEPLIVVQGLNKLGPDATAEQLRAYLASYVGPGVMGQYNFPAHPQRGLDASTVVIILYDKAHQSFVPVSRFGGVPQ